MKIDRHHDPYANLEQSLLNDISAIATQLNAKLHISTISNSNNDNTQKRITLTYDLID